MSSKFESVNNYNNKVKRRKKRNKYFFYTFLVIFFVAIASILSMTVFFNISDIAVTGNSYYTTQQIKLASTLEEGQNLFRLNKFEIIKQLKKELPYLSDVVIDRHLPVGIEIIVTETKAFMCVETDTGTFLLDENLKVLEAVDTPPEALPHIVGLKGVTAAVGEYLTGEGTPFENLSRLAPAIKTEIGNVTDIDLSTSYDINFEFDGRITVKLGTLEKLTDKLALVRYVLDENQSNEFAIIDVSNGTRAYYRSVVPEKEEETTEEEEKTEENTDEETSEKEENTTEE